MKRSLLGILFMLLMFAFATRCMAVVSMFDYTIKPGGDTTANSYFLDNGDSPAEFEREDANMKLLNAANSLTAYYLQCIRNAGTPWLTRTNLSIAGNYVSSQSGSNSFGWNAGFSTIQPFLGELQEGTKHIPFWQLGYSYSSGNSSTAGSQSTYYGQQTSAKNTANVGIGYRYLFPNHWALIGLNGFFDAALNPNHQRGGAGVELFLGALELRANQYYPISGAQQLGVDPVSGYNVFEQAAAGYDYEAGLNFSVLGAPWLYAAAQGYQYQFTHSYNGVQSNNYSGMTFSVALNILPELKLKAIYNNNGDGNNSPSGIVQLNYNLAQNVGPSLFNDYGITTDVVNREASDDLIYKALQPVGRNNTIVVERYTQINPTPPTGTGRLVLSKIYTAYGASTEIAAGSVVSIFKSTDTSKSKPLATVAYSSSNGVTFDGMAAGNYIVSMSPYVSANDIWVPGSGSMVTITANNIITTTGYVKGNPGSATIILSVNGVASVGTTVRVSGPVTQTTTTDSNGWATFDSLTAGTYEVSFTNPLPTVYGTPKRLDDITVTAGGSVAQPRRAYYNDNVNVTCADSGVTILVDGSSTGVTTDSSISVWYGSHSFTGVKSGSSSGYYGGTVVISDDSEVDVALIKQ